MSKHKSEDYKITTVKYYLENNTNYTKTCEIFKSYTYNTSQIQFHIFCYIVYILKKLKKNLFVNA